MAKLMFAYKISIGYPLIMLALFALIVIVQNHLAYGKPYSPPGVMDPPSSQIKNISNCENDGSVDEICQRCAKITKSPLVYPMCCKNEEEVKVWCVEFMSFGLQ